MPGHRDDGHENPDLLEVHTRPLHDGSFLLTVTGVLDHHTADRLTDALRPVLRAEAPTVLLDLSGVSFLDSTGLTRLLIASRAAGSAGGRLLLVTPSPPVRHMLEITGIDQVISSHPGPDAVPAPADGETEQRGRQG
ncbi:STAS domain-containing protein [Streptomyces rishiriensis]|uniref:Anti-sigma factor antagonist n=1 Tax=Streptomyces rishiriensis TaxID=68264 RepID=A0ABU0NYR7_STRRH|nr:STAS domain-containing protein [Streptomyces rishiriensis]MDQ0584297.1 anti-sigma B factor antagonist [Streptomyces rishiriensis]